MKNIVLIGVGSNLGDKVSTCRSAIDRLDHLKEIRILKRSSLYKTEPVGYLDQEWFVNCVIKVETAFGPYELLGCLKNLEGALGRQKTFLWGPRVIDLDILLFNKEELRSKGLQIPHPHLHERAFVLVPLCEIDPQAFHPCLNKTARTLLENLGEIKGVERI